MRVRLVVAELVLVVGQEVSVVVLQILEVLAGCPVARVFWVLVGPAMLGFFALVFTAVALVRKRVRMVVHPGAALRSLLQLFPCCSPAKVGSLQHTGVRLSVVAVVFATFFPPWSHQASWAGPDPMYHQRVLPFCRRHGGGSGPFLGGALSLLIRCTLGVPATVTTSPSILSPSQRGGSSTSSPAWVLPARYCSVSELRVVSSSSRLRVCGFTVCSPML